jgi:hypothetical protein
MGFSGGGSNILKSHTHDGNIVQDGGSLNMDNVTQAGLTSGDLVFSDGSHLQRLAIGNAAEALVVNGAGTFPEWGSTGGGAAWELVSHNTYGAGTGSATISISPAISCADISQLMINWCFQLSTTSAHVQLRINGVSSAYYDLQRQKISGGSDSGAQSLNQSEWDLLASHGTNSFGTVWLNAFESNDDLIGTFLGMGTDLGGNGSLRMHTENVTEFNEVYFNINGSHTMQGYIDIYKLNNS